MCQRIDDTERESKGEAEMEHDGQLCMTEGPIGRELLQLALPVLLSQLLQQFYNIADASIIGQAAGAVGLAAVGSAGLLLSVMVNFFIGLSTGVSVVAAQMFGAGQYERLKACIHTAVAAALAFGVVFQAAGFAGTDRLLFWLGTPQDAMEPCRRYLRICFWGMAPQLVYNVGTAILRALGNTRSPLYYLTFCSALNIGLDYLFVVVWHLDVQGAAAATLLSQFLSAVLVWGRLKRLSPAFRLRFSGVRMHGAQLKLLAAAGIPAGLQAVFMSISSLVIQTSINSFGTAAMAGMTVFSKVEGFLYFPLFSLGIAVTSFVGQNAGAGQFERIRTGMRISVWVGLGLWAVFAALLLAAEPLVLAIFTTDQAVLENAQTAIRYIFPFYCLYAVNQVYIGVLRGMGHTFSPMAVTILCYCAFRIVWCSLLLPLRHDMRVIYLSYILSWVIMIVLLAVCCRRSLEKEEAALTPSPLSSSSDKAPYPGHSD